MLEHKYYVCKSSWCICINILAGYEEYSDYTNVGENSRTIKITDGLWLRFEKNPDMQDNIYNYVESFIKGLCDDYLSHLVKGLKTVQEEGLTAAIIEWASKMFKFEPPAINVSFQK